MFGLGLGRLGASGSAFSPSSVAGKRLWLRPSVTAGMWQDSAGTTSMSAVGTLLDTSNPVGLMLDYSQGAALGPELVTNGDCSSLTGWSAYGGEGASIVSGRMKISLTAGGGGFTGGRYQDIAVVAGQSKWVSASIETTEIAGGSNQVDFFVYDGAGFSGALAQISQNTVGSKSVTLLVRPTGSVIRIYARVYSDPSCTTTGYFDNISVREIPGIHLTQATSTARPVLSARRNLLTKTEDLTDAVYRKQFCTVNSATTFSPAQYGNVSQSVNTNAGQSYTLSFTAYSVSGNTALHFFHENSQSGDYSPVALSGTLARYSVTFLGKAGGGAVYCGLQDRNASGNGTLYLTDLQVELGPTATPYQRVDTASDYTPIIPQYVKYDGTDDALASATLTAGTLGSNVDAFMVVRRDTAANVVLAYADASHYFGVAENDPSGDAFLNSGNATVWVDGVQLAGGSSVKRASVNAALTAGEWHVLELRNLNLSTWTSFKSGNYAGAYQLNGGMGEVFIADAMPDATRAKVRTYLGKTVGKVL